MIYYVPVTIAEFTPSPPKLLSLVYYFIYFLLVIQSSYFKYLSSILFIHFFITQLLVEQPKGHSNLSFKVPRYLLYSKISCVLRIKIFNFVWDYIRSITFLTSTIAHLIFYKRLFLSTKYIILIILFDILLFYLPSLHRQSYL